MKKNIIIIVLLFLLIGATLYAAGDLIVMGTIESRGGYKFPDGSMQTTAAILPSGAVLAFNLTACPAGWSEFTDGKGRMIVGVGTNVSDGTDIQSFALGQKEGKYQHQLSEAEMPSHTHAYNYRPSGVTAGSGSTLRGYVDWASNTSGTAGQGQPHNNMPPHVALLYCVKD